MLSGSDEPPAGTLGFENRGVVPHEIRLEVLNVGTSYGERVDGHDTVTGAPVSAIPDAGFTSTAVLEPGERDTYDSVFGSPVLYDVRFTLDGTYPGEDLGRVVFDPTWPDDSEGRGSILVGEISESDELMWVVEATDNLGTFA